eukprot:Opistho-2@50163
MASAIELATVSSRDASFDKSPPFGINVTCTRRKWYKVQRDELHTTWAEVVLHYKEKPIAWAVLVVLLVSFGGYVSALVVYSGSLTRNSAMFIDYNGNVTIYDTVTTAEAFADLSEYGYDLDNTFVPIMNLDLLFGKFEPGNTGASMAVIMNFYPPKNFMQSAFPPKMNVTFTMYVDSSFQTFEKGKPLVEYSALARSQDGNLLLYPFDHYAFHIEMYPLYPDGGDNEFLMQALINTQDVGVFSVEVTPFKSADTAFRGIDVKFYRGSLFKVYPVVVVVGMWLIIITEIWVAYLLVVNRWRKLENPTLLSFFASLIFALPSLRNSMPQAPAIGTVIDYGAFFWAEGFAMVCLFVSAARYNLDSKPVVKKPALSLA